MIEIARALGEGRLQLDNVLDIEQGIKALTALPGIGSWTASYIAMRAGRGRTCSPPAIT